MNYKIPLICLMLPISVFADDENVKTFVASHDFCLVEIREGNKPFPTDNQVIYSGPMKAGDQKSTKATFLFAQREGNPGVCNSGRGQWNSCSWDTCQLD